MKVGWSLVETEDGCLIFQSELGIIAAVHANGCVDLCGSGSSDEIHACNLDDLISSLRNLKRDAKKLFQENGIKQWPK